VIWLAAVVGLIGLEAGATRLFGRPGYGWRDSEVSLGLALGWAAAAMATGGLSLWIIQLGYDHRLIDLNQRGPWTLAAAIVAADFLYYLWHRASHAWRWMWATHFVHHTAGRMNILASFRQGWTDPVSGTWLTFAPLGLLGFSPEVCGAYFTLLLVVQAAAHNEWAPRLGPLEWVLVTPSNHRVHHSLRREHWDRNFGGVLVVWDRLFGTYAPEGERLTAFGHSSFDPAATNPIEIATREWRLMARDALRRFRRPATPAEP
jgi:sterol desaturase/sphingolipid hydroxylase (fatty acid hydroxylase superfamily)